MRNGTEGDSYIQKFPMFKKWINECICCHEKGYNPSLPERISLVEGSLGTYYIKKYYKPLSLNEDGLCEQCSKIINGTRPSK